MLCTIMSVHRRPPPPLLFPLNPTMHMLPYHFRGIPLVQFTLSLMWLMQFQVYKCRKIASYIGPLVNLGCWFVCTVYFQFTV